MNKCANVILGLVVCLIFTGSVRAEAIYHEKFYPDGSGPFPAVIALHTSGGFKTVKHLIQGYVDDGFAVYAPNFFVKHGITPRSRMDTFDRFREDIEKDLSEIVGLMTNDPKVQKENIFATGFSNGGFWVSYLTGTSKVSAGVSHYGVWKANFGRKMINPYPMKYFSKSSTPILALHGGSDGVQRIKFAEEAWDELRSRGARLETHIYSDAGHAWDRKNHRKYVYNESVTKDSHKRTIEFFKKYMK
jgi:carboxymethylenebutenolidase